MNIISQLTSKPWLASDPSVAASRILGGNAAKTALMFFLLVVTVLFFLITITFLARSQYPDFIALAGQPWLPFTRPVTLWINSALLLIACILMRLSMANSIDNRSRTLVALGGAALFSCLFLTGQALVWLQLTKDGFAINANPANSYFYLFTGVHALHLAGGFVALIRAVMSFARHTDVNRLKASLRLCTLYWHYLFVVWMLLFALLTATPETYQTIALLCGF